MDDGFGAFGGVPFGGESLAGDAVEFGVDVFIEAVFGVAVSGADAGNEGGEFGMNFPSVLGGGVGGAWG